MMMMAAALPLLATGGCVRTVAGVVTAPVRLAGKAVGGTVDMMTTSEKEKDEKYVRAMRKRDAAEAKEREQRDKECRKHPDRCDA
jgi:hypothetical protein